MAREAIISESSNAISPKRIAGTGLVGILQLEDMQAGSVVIMLSTNEDGSEHVEISPKLKEESGIAVVRDPSK